MNTNGATPTNNKFALPNTLTEWLVQAGIAVLYVLLGHAIHLFISNHGIVSLVWPGSGLALAAVLLGGRRYLWGVLLGALLLNVLANDSLWAVFGITLANVLEALLGARMLSRNDTFASSLNTLADYLRLIAWGGAIAGIVGAVTGALSLLLAGVIHPADYFEIALHWWMGDVLGVVLVTPLILAEWQARSEQLTHKQLLEGLLLAGITLVVGQIVFLGWFHESLGNTPKAYLMFLCISLVAIRMGTRGVTLVVLMIAVQGALSALQGTGYFAYDVARTDLHNYWLYMLTLSVVGVTLSTHVHELKQALEALRLKDTALDAAANSIVITDVTGRIEWANQAFSRLTGYGINEACGRNPRELLKSDLHDKTYYQSLWGTILSNKVWRGEIVNRRKDGSLYDEEMIITPLTNKQGEITHFVAVKQEITERKQAEQQLRIAATAFELHEGMIITDAHCMILRVNQAFTDITGYTAEEAIGQTPRLLSSGRHGADFYAAMWASISNTGSWEGEVWNRRKNGEVYPEWLNITAVKNERGEVTHYVASLNDITEYKKIEAATLQAKEQAEILAKSKSEFLANMSHEIRTPMNAIIGLSRLALNKNVTDEVRDYLEKINTSSESLLGILNDILDFSKMEAGKLGIENTRFNLNTVLDNLRNLFSVRAQEKYLGFAVELAPGTPTDLVGDALRIQQILSNLLGNAIKFTEQGKVAVQVHLLESEKSQARMRFSVSDTGIGISQEDLAKLFQPFSQADSSITRRFGGTGLGLTISHRLLQLMGSDIRVESTPGQGTTFSFDLLLGIASPELRQETERRHTEREAGTLAHDLRKRAQLLNGARILVAEDNRINQQVVKEFLQLSGIAVDIANNGKEALQWLAQHAYAAVLMDMHMPVMSGAEATEHIRRQPEFSTLPIIALTAGVTQEERDRCTACGMNDFVAKPVNPEELIGVLSHWLGKQQNMVTAAQASPPAQQPAQCTLQHLPGFDFANLLAMVGDDEEVVMQLLDMFRTDIATALVDIEAHIREHQVDAAKKLVHTIKGTAGNIGAIELHAEAAALGASLKKGSLDPAACASFQKVLQETLARLAQLK